MRPTLGVLPPTLPSSEGRMHRRDGESSRVDRMASKTRQINPHAAENMWAPTMCFERRRQNTKTRKHRFSKQLKTRKHENTGILSRKHTKTHNLGKILPRRCSGAKPKLVKERRVPQMRRKTCAQPPSPCKLPAEAPPRRLHPRWSSPSHSHCTCCKIFCCKIENKDEGTGKNSL